MLINKSTSYAPFLRKLLLDVLHQNKEVNQETEGGSRQQILWWKRGQRELEDNSVESFLVDY